MTEISVANLSALQLVQAARAQQSEVEAGSIPGPGLTFRFGPPVDALRGIDPRLVTEVTVTIEVTDEGEPVTTLIPMVDTANVASLAWAAAAEAGDRIAALETRVRELESHLAEFL